MLREVHEVYSSRRRSVMFPMVRAFGTEKMESTVGVLVVSSGLGGGLW